MPHLNFYIHSEHFNLYDGFYLYLSFVLFFIQSCTVIMYPHHILPICFFRHWLPLLPFTLHRVCARVYRAVYADAVYSFSMCAHCSAVCLSLCVCLCQTVVLFRNKTFLCAVGVNTHRYGYVMRACFLACIFV